ncbi:putative Pentatricopeptide repeat-containing protein [Abeliophyllum distichum]|uniref:Pentatricopeptide repeat-containing protein n=1 Tax=Abeliophyllum distichum TaxID=126358 RepID=A0ABD1ULT3_9LAMI
MREKRVNATAESLAVVISVCADSDFNGFQKGEIVHAYVMTGGFDNYVFVRNSLIHMYGKNGAIEEAEYLLSRLESKSILSWNALISSYAESGLCDEAFSVFLQMENSDGDSVGRPNVVSWSAVINGFAAKGRHEESLELFRRMQLDSVLANAIIIATMLSVCAELSALHLFISVFIRNACPQAIRSSERTVLARADRGKISFSCLARARKQCPLERAERGLSLLCLFRLPSF